MKLRGRARDRGWSLSEKGFLRLGADGEPLTGDAAELRTFPTETEAYAFLDLAFIEPELREDRGEIEAAAAGTLPRLIDDRRPARRPALALGLVGRGPHDRADGRDRPSPRPRLPGPDRPQPVAGDRPRPDARPGRAPARDHRRSSTTGSRPRRPPGSRRPPRRPRASGCSTAASWRSGPTAGSTTRTSSSPGSTWSSPRSTSAAGSRASS